MVLMFDWLKLCAMDFVEKCSLVVIKSITYVFGARICFYVHTYEWVHSNKVN